MKKTNIKATRLLKDGAPSTQPSSAPSRPTTIRSSIVTVGPKTLKKTRTTARRVGGNKDKPAFSSATSSFTTRKFENHGQNPSVSSTLNSASVKQNKNTRKEPNKSRMNRAGNVGIRIGNAAQHFWKRLLGGSNNDRNITRAASDQRWGKSSRNWEKALRGILHVPPPAIASASQGSGNQTSDPRTEEKVIVTSVPLLTLPSPSLVAEKISNNSTPGVRPLPLNEQRLVISTRPSVPLHPLMLAVIPLYYVLRYTLSFKRRTQMARSARRLLKGGGQFAVSQDELAKQIGILKRTSEAGVSGEVDGDAPRGSPDSSTSSRSSRRGVSDRKSFMQWTKEDDKLHLVRQKVERLLKCTSKAGVSEEVHGDTSRCSSPDSSTSSRSSCQGVSDRQAFVQWMKEDEERQKVEELTIDAVCANERAEILAEQLTAMKKESENTKRCESDGSDGTYEDMDGYNGVTDQESFVKWMKDDEKLHLALSRQEQLTADAVCANERACIAQEDLEVLKQENASIIIEKKTLVTTLQEKTQLHARAVEEAAVVSKENFLLKDMVISLEAENLEMDKEMERMMDTMRDDCGQDPESTVDVRKRHEGEAVEFDSASNLESGLGSLTEDEMDAQLEQLRKQVDETTALLHLTRMAHKIAIEELQNKLNISSAQHEEDKREKEELLKENDILKVEVNALRDTHVNHNSGAEVPSALNDEAMDELVKLYDELSILKNDTSLSQESDDDLSQTKEEQEELLKENDRLEAELDALREARADQNYLKAQLDALQETCVNQNNEVEVPSALGGLFELPLFELRNELSTLQNETSLSQESDEDLPQTNKVDDYDRAPSPGLEEDLERLVQEKVDLFMEVSTLKNELAAAEKKNVGLVKRLEEGQSKTPTAVEFSPGDVSLELPPSITFEPSMNREIRAGGEGAEQGLRAVHCHLNSAYVSMMGLMKDMETTIETNGGTVSALTAKASEPHVESEQSPHENSPGQATALIEQVNVLAQLQESQANAFQTKRGEEHRVLSTCREEHLTNVNTAAISCDSVAELVDDHPKRKTSLRRLWKKRSPL